MFTVVIIGRPNVGKSSLFNDLLGYRRTIVLDLPGTTVDTIEEKVEWGQLKMVDCQGIFSEGDTEILRKLLAKADACVFVVDAIAGLTPFDKWIGQEIRVTRKPTLLCLNKSEAKKAYTEDEFASLRFDEVLPISAAHKTNVAQVKEWCVAQVPKEDAEEVSGPPEKKVIKLALVGRPNTGKSTLMNRLARAEVSRVSPLPLTTRDPITSEIETNDAFVRLIDTAGMRRPRSKKEDVETYSVHATTRTIRESDVIFLLIRTDEDISDQDMRLLSLLEREGRPCAILLNFTDKMNQKQRIEYKENTEFYRYLENFKTLEISGLTGKNCDKLIPLAKKLYIKSHRRVKTSKLNKIVETIVARNPPPSSGNQNFNILYASQVRVDPPTFVFFMNRKGNLPLSYKRYIENKLKDNLGFKGQAVRVLFRGNDKRH